MRVWDMSLLQDDLPAKKAETEHIYNYVDSEENRRRIDRRFTMLQHLLAAGLIIGFLVPNILLLAYFNRHFGKTLEHSAGQTLAALAEARRGQLDAWLRERVANLEQLLPRATQEGDTAAWAAETLPVLQWVYPGFRGLAILDADGAALSGAGTPLPVASSGEPAAWLRPVLEGKRPRGVGDSFTDGTGRVGFALALRLERGGALAAVLDLAGATEIAARGVDAASAASELVSKAGAASAMAEELALPPPPQTGVGERIEDGVAALVAGARLAEAPWVLVLRRSPAVPLAERDQVQSVLVAAFVCLSLLFSLILYHTIGWLMRGARRMAGQESRLQEMLAHASRLASIGELASGVAHEINNPLAIIMAESGVIRDMFNPEFDLDHSPEALYKELDVIDRAADRAKGITRRLQEMGRTSRERSEPCDLNEQARLVLERLKKSELKGKNLDARFEPAPGTPPVLAEAERLRQVIANILVNAADAIGDAPGRITVTTRQEGDKAVVAIADSGRGIPPENLERIFHPFFTTKAGGRGAGLGLSIAASIVKTLGGVIKVQSAPGKGSVFTVLLPGHFSGAVKE